MRRWSLPASLLAALLLIACGEPPSKEMDQAQGAVDAARAAGAERYAKAEFAAATDALAAARQAVNERDYRLALNDALESREHAQNAAREAGDTKARLRGEAEHMIAEVTALLTQARKMVSTAREPRRVIQAHQRSIDAAMNALQEAGAEVGAEDYAAVTATLTSPKNELVKVINQLDTASRAQTPRRRS